METSFSVPHSQGDWLYSNEALKRWYYSTNADFCDVNTVQKSSSMAWGYVMVDKYTSSSMPISFKLGERPFRINLAYDSVR